MTKNHIWVLSKEDGRFWECSRCHKFVPAITEQLKTETCEHGDTGCIQNRINDNLLQRRPNEQIYNNR